MAGLGPVSGRVGRPEATVAGAGRLDGQSRELRPPNNSPRRRPVFFYTTKTKPKLKWARKKQKGNNNEQI